jgi:nicotinamidase/pyrazinamidase
MKRALVVIDMIEDFAHEGGALYCGPSMERIIPVIKTELARARAGGEPVIYLTDNHVPDDAEFKVFPPHAIAGTKGAEIIPELAPEDDEDVIPKRRYSGFFGTDLDITLRERDIDTLRLVGDCTNICVLYTAAEARYRDYAVEVPADCVATFDPDAHTFALKQMQTVLGANVTELPASAPP